MRDEDQPDPRDLERRALRMFEELEPLEEGERSARLDALAPEPALRALVQELLRADRDPTRIRFATAMRTAARDWVIEEPGDNAIKTGEVVGDYRLLQLLGVGGMGLVFLAERERPNRRVAVKILHRGIADEAHRQRFHREVELLGRIEHPLIARLYEAGTERRDDRDLPWFAMEWIDGVPFDVHCRQRGDDVRSLVGLLVHVCEAVGHAHRLGIVHRDLKPANILVPRDGKPRVVDFGLARSVTPELAWATGPTRTGDLLGTVAYMAPEVLRGRADSLDARVDVYALGVIAYELLCGRLPSPVRELSLREAIATILDGRFPPPSELRRELRGDLETIITKALQLSPGHRYRDANELGEDLSRYLANRPIAARPPSVAYKLNRYMRRHFALISVSALVVVASGVGAGLALFHAEKSKAAEKRASEERDHALAMLDYLRNTISKAAIADNTADEEMSLGRFLEFAAEELDGARFDDAQLAAELRLIIAQHFRELGRYREGLAQAEALIAAGADEEFLIRAHLDQADCLMQLERYPEAIEILEQLTDHPDLSAERRLRALNTRSLALRYTNRNAEALVVARQAHELASSLPSVPQHRGVTASNLAGLLAREGKLDDARPLYEEAVEVLGETYREGHATLAALRNNLAKMELDCGNHAAAAAGFGQAAEELRKIHDEPNTMLAAVLNNQAYTLWVLREDERVDELYREVLRTYATTVGTRTRGYQEANFNWALWLESDGQWDEAAEAFREFTDYSYENDNGLSRGSLAAQARLGHCLARLGENEEAEELLEAVIELGSDEHGTNSSPVRFAESALHFARTGRPDPGRFGTTFEFEPDASETAGALVEFVAPASLAWEAGLREKDRIVRFAGRAVRPPGEAVRMEDAPSEFEVEFVGANGLHYSRTVYVDG